MIVVFFLATTLLLLPHFGYPLLVFGLSRLKQRRAVGHARPSVSLIISAYNEADVIREKIENALAIDYPQELLEVMVISDASDDSTDTIVAEYADRNVRLCRQEVRLGKSAGLSRFCPTAKGEVLVFTDANSMFQENALANLVRHFDDPQVGYSVGCQLYANADQDASALAENTYWNFELKLKAWESRLSSVVGADGAIYALRKNLFEPLEPEDINDFLLPLKVIAKGYRGVFDQEAICFENAAPDFRGEFRRKYRIVNRSLRAVLKVPQVFNPLRVGWFAFQLVAHKVLRWFGPIFLLASLLSNAYLAAGEWSETGAPRVFSVLLALQFAGYLLAALYSFPPLRKIRLIYIAYYFLLVNCAAAVGIGLLLTGRTVKVWKPQR